MHVLDAVIQLKDNFSGTLQTVERNMGQFSKTVKRAGQSMKQTGRNLERIGGNLTKTVTLPLVGISGAAIKLGMDFEASMSNVSALSGATGNDLKMLEEKAREMGSKTSKSAKDAADAMGYMALAGWKQKEITEAIEPVLRLSEAGNIDLARASSLVTDSMSSLGLVVEELDDYLDILAQTARSSNTDIDQMAEAYIAVGGTLRGLSIPIHHSSIALGMLANAGIKGGEAGKAFNAILTNLTAPAGRAKKALDKLNFSAFDSKGNFKGLENVLFDLKGKLEKLTPEQKNMYLSMIGGKEHVKDLNALLNGLGDSYDELKGEIGKADGALIDMATTMQDNNKGSITQLKSALEEVGLKIYDVLKPAVADTVDILQKFVDILNNLTPEQQEAIVNFAKMAITVGPTVGVIGKLTKEIGFTVEKIGKFSGRVKKAGGVLQALATPGNKVALVIAGIALAAYLVYKNWDKISAFFKGIGESATNTFNWVKDTITSSIETVNDITTNAKDTILGTWENFTTSISNIIETCKTTVVDTFTNIKTTIVGIWNNIVNTVSNVIGNFVEFITTKFSVQIFLFGTILNNIKNIFKNVWEAIKTIVGGIAIVVWDLVTGNFEQLQKDVAGIFGRLKVIFGNIWQNIKDIFVSYLWIIGFTMQDIWNGIVTAAQTIWDTFKGYMANLWQTIKTIAITSWISLKTSVIDLCASTKQWIIDIWNSVIAWFTTLPERLYVAGVNMFTSLKNGIVSMKNSVVSSAKNAGKSVIDAIKNLPQRALEIGKNIMTSLGQGIKNSVLNPIKSIKQVGDSAIQALRDKLGIASPSKVMLEMGKFTTEGFAKGIEANTGMIEKPANYMVTQVERPVTHNINTTNSPKTSRNININIHMHGVAVREESDVDKIAAAIVQKIKKAEIAYGGA